MQQHYSSLGSHAPGTEANTLEAEATKLKDKISAEAKAKAEQIQQESRRLMENAKEQGRSVLAERKNAVADEIVGMAQALRNACHERQQQPSLVTPYAERIADGLERFSNTLRERDLSSLIGQVEDFARRQPGIFIGASVAAGFLLGRFVKSSAAHREQDYAHLSSASGGPDIDYSYSSPATEYESRAASQAPDVIYASPPPDVAATVTPPVVEADISTARTTTLFEEEVRDEDKLGTQSGAPAAGSTTS